VTQGDALPGFDLYCPILSLPRAFGTTLDTIPADVPYLRAPAAHLDKWRPRLPQAGGLRVGINWAGNPDFRWDQFRSIGLARLLPILAARHVRFFALQNELRDGDTELLRGQPGVAWLGREIETFADTAAIISHLDLVISSDTSVVHLAGALGKPVWVLLASNPDWRWLLERGDSPWYPTARLFRQSARDDWSGVVARVGAELGQLAEGQDSASPT
jgi:ADP-heptose:LPS heptosyltransferase